MGDVGDGAQVVVSANAYGGQRRVEIELNKSVIIDLPAGVAEVIASQPAVAAAIILQDYLDGRAPSEAPTGSC